MALRNFVGFETGDLTEVGSSGTVSVVTSPVRSGTYALKVNPTTTGTGYALVGDMAATGVANAGSNFTPTFGTGIATSFVRFYFQYTTKPASNDEPIIQFQSEFVLGSSVPTAQKLEVRLASTGVLKAYNTGNTLLATGTTTLSSGTWYRIEVKCGTGASGGYEVKINGTSEFSGTGNLDTHNAKYCFFGKANNRNGQSVVYYYDDIYIDDAAYIGDSIQTLLTPSAAGHYATGWTGAVSKIQDVPPDGDTSFLSDSTANDVASFTCAQVGPFSSVNAVKLIAEARTTTSGGSFKIRLRSNTTDTDTTGSALTTSYAVYAKVFSTDPATSAAWLYSAVNVAEAGMVTTTAPSSSGSFRVTALYLMVDAPPSWAVTGSGGLNTGSGSTSVLQFVRSGSGGMFLNGAADASFTPSSQTYTGTGGLLFSNTVPVDSVSISLTATGGITPEGASANAAINSWLAVASGGLFVSGSTSDTEQESYAGGGGMFLGSGASAVFLFSYAASGGVITGQAVPADYVNVFLSASGGVFVSNSANLGQITIGNQNGGGGLLFGGAADAAQISFRLVQIASITNGSFATSLTVSINSTIAGNGLIALWGSGFNSAPIPVFPSGWQIYGNCTTSGSNIYLAYLANNPGGLTSVTVTNGGGAYNQVLIVSEWSGLNKTQLTDGPTVANQSTSTTPTSGTFNNSNPQDLIVMGIVQGRNSGTNDTITYSNPTNGFVIERQADSLNGTYINLGVAFLDKQVIATGSYSGGVTSNRLNLWGTVVGAFKADQNNYFTYAASGGLNVSGSASGLCIRQIVTTYTGNSSSIDGKWTFDTTVNSTLLAIPSASLFSFQQPSAPAGYSLLRSQFSPNFTEYVGCFLSQPQTVVTSGTHVTVTFASNNLANNLILLDVQGLSITIPPFDASASNAANSTQSISALTGPTQSPNADRELYLGIIGITQAAAFANPINGFKILTQSSQTNQGLCVLGLLTAVAKNIGTAIATPLSDAAGLAIPLFLATPPSYGYHGTGGIVVGASADAQAFVVVGSGGLSFSNGADAFATQFGSGGLFFSGSSDVIPNLVFTGSLLIGEGDGVDAGVSDVQLSASGGTFIGGSVSAWQNPYQASGGMALSGVGAGVIVEVAQTGPEPHISGSANIALSFWTYSAKGYISLSGATSDYEQPYYSVSMSGGLRTSNGGAVTGYSIAFTMSGGIILGSTARATPIVRSGSSGGVSISGASAFSVIAPSGLLRLSGSASVSPLTSVYIGSGGLNLSNSAPKTIIERYTASMGLLLGGSAGAFVQKRFTANASGGLFLSGSAGAFAQKRFAANASGGLFLSGSAGIPTISMPWTGSGRLLLSGTSPAVQYTGQFKFGPAETINITRINTIKMVRDNSRNIARANTRKA